MTVVVTTTVLVPATIILDAASTSSSSSSNSSTVAPQATSPNKTLGLDLGARDDLSVMNTENDKGMADPVSMVLIAGAVGGLILLFGMVVVARKTSFPRRSAKGQLDILKIAKKSNIFADPAQYARFCRSISFHGLRYNETFLSISNTNLMLVYDLLLLERPEASDLGSLRFICTQFLRKDVFRDPPQYIDRSVGFIEESLIDVVLEELLDIYVQADRVAAQYSEAGCKEYAECGDPLYEEAVPLSRSDHLADSPEVPYEHFYDAIDEYLVGKRCVEPGTYAVPSDKDPIYSELMLLTGFYRGSNRPLTYLSDTEYSVIKMPDGDNRKSSLISGAGFYNVANHQGASNEYMVANHRDSGASYQVANPRSSAMYEVANIRASAVYETANGDGGGGKRGSNVYDNVSGQGAEGRSSIVYETAGAMDADRPGSTVYETAGATGADRRGSTVYETAGVMNADRRGSTVYEMGTAANIEVAAVATVAKENQMSPIYKVAKKAAKKTPKRSGLTLGDIGNQGRLREPAYDLTAQPPVPPRLGNPPTSTPQIQRATPKQRKGRSQFAVGVPVTQRSSIFLLAGLDLQLPDQVNRGDAVAATAAAAAAAVAPAAAAATADQLAEQPAEQTPNVPIVSMATPQSAYLFRSYTPDFRPPSCPLYDNTIGDGMLMEDVCAFNITPSNNSQMIADISIGEFPAYEEPDYLNQEDLATITMTEIKAEANFGSRDDALISAIDDTIVVFQEDQSTGGEEEDVGNELDFSGKRSMVLCSSSSSRPCFPRAPFLFADPGLDPQN